MEHGRFERLKARVTVGLTAPQCLQLAAVLRQKAQSGMAEVIIDQGAKMVREDRKCRLCGHGDVVLHGKDERGRQRFRCRKTDGGGCGRTFNGITGTVLARMRQPDQWLNYVQTMPTHLSVAKTAEKLGVAHVTAHRWRVRLLSVQAVQEAATLKGVVEADETFFRSSYKGSRGWKRGHPPEDRLPRYRGGAAIKPGLSGEQIPVLTAVDRADGAMDRVLRSRAGIVAAIEGKIEKGSVLCSDGLVSYAEVAGRAGAEHRRIEPPRKDWLAKAKGGKPRRRGKLGLGHVNAHHQRLKQFINGQARGVSTKHLPDYLGWSRAVRRPGFTPVLLLADTLIHRYV
jgi:transposase-like protein